MRPSRIPAAGAFDAGATSARFGERCRPELATGASHAGRRTLTEPGQNVSSATVVVRRVASVLKPLGDANYW